MSLVPIGKDTHIDTDDLDNQEYHYYCKAKNLEESLPYNDENYQTVNKYRLLKYSILCGRLSAYEIETNPKYEWFRD